VKPKNLICHWYDKDALVAARFYAATFSDNQVTAVHKWPSDSPNGKNAPDSTSAAAFSARCVDSSRAVIPPNGTGR